MFEENSTYFFLAQLLFRTHMSAEIGCRWGFKWKGSRPIPFSKQGVLQLSRGSKLCSSVSPLFPVCLLERRIGYNQFFWRGRQSLLVLIILLPMSVLSPTLISMTTLWSRHYYSHFTDEKNRSLGDVIWFQGYTARNAGDRLQTLGCLIPKSMLSFESHIIFVKTTCAHGSRTKSLFCISPYVSK